MKEFFDYRIDFDELEDEAKEIDSFTNGIRTDRMYEKLMDRLNNSEKYFDVKEQEAFESIIPALKEFAFIQNGTLEIESESTFGAFTMEMDACYLQDMSEVQKMVWDYMAAHNLMIDKSDMGIKMSVHVDYIKRRKITEK